MKHTMFILFTFIVPIFINANEFQHIQPIAVEEAPVKTVVAPKPKEIVEIKAVEQAIEVQQTQEEVPKDEDGDGVIDENDKCPNTPKGIKVNEIGCELDSDDDGVKDSKDQCPGTSKEFVVDGYGCPQTATLKVNFETNSYAISEELIDDLKDFALFLQNNVGYQVIIYGHTDSNGSDKLNKELSQNRANTVREALVRYGIDEIRLTSIGKGSSEPIADNNTKEGRAENRRIEVELVQ